MSFSTDAKSELARLALHSKIEAMLELSSMARFGGVVALSDGGTTLRFVSEHPDVIERVVSLARFLYGISPEISAQQNENIQKRPMFRADLPERQMNSLFAESGFDLFATTFAEEVILGRLDQEDNARAFLRGAFLSAGSVTDPEKAYHLEIVARRPFDCAMLLRSLEALSLAAKEAQRGDASLFYIKDSESIADLLVALGAMRAMLTLENIKAGKEVRNGINRKSNAETANLDKQYRAALAQIQAIERLRERGQLSTLPQSLQDLAQVRMEHPMANLRELGAALAPPLGKSGVMHRMRRLLQLATMGEEE